MQPDAATTVATALANPLQALSLRARSTGLLGQTVVIATELLVSA